MAKRRSGLDARSQNVVDRMVDMLRGWNGEGRNPGDEVITRADLEQAIRDGTGPAGRLVRGIGEQLDRDRPPAGLPHAPENVEARGAFELVLLRFDAPHYQGHAYTEVWRSTEDAPGNAALVGTTSSRIFSDYDLEPGRTYYYWVRFVNLDGVAGPFQGSAGIEAATAPSADYVREQLTSEAWQSNRNYSLFEVVRPTGQAVWIGNLQVAFQCVAAGQSGGGEPNWAQVGAFGDQLGDGGVLWEAIDASRRPLILGEVDGRPTVLMPGAFIEEASIESAKIRDLAANKLFVDQGTIAQALIGQAHITRGMLQTAIIDTAYIETAAVDTLRLRGQAVTIPRSSYAAERVTGAGVNSGTGPWETLSTVQFPGHLGDGAPAWVCFAARMLISRNTIYLGCNLQIRIRCSYWDVYGGGSHEEIILNVTHVLTTAANFVHAYMTPTVLHHPDSARWDWARYYEFQARVAEVSGSHEGHPDYWARPAGEARSGLVMEVRR